MVISMFQCYPLYFTLVEVNSSVLLVGHYACFIGALILERVGDFWTGAITLCLGTTAYSVLYVLSLFPDPKYNTEYAVVLPICFAAIGETLLQLRILAICVTSILRRLLNTRDGGKQ